MAFNPLDSRQSERLFRAMSASYRHLKPFRELNRTLTEEFAGSNYGGEAVRPRYEIMVNLLQQTVSAYTMTLAANNPKILVTTKHREFEFFAKKFQAAVNNLIEEINLEQTLKRAILDAFLCVGVVKIHLADSAPIILEEDRFSDPGIPFASNIAIDNFVYDMTASRYSSVRYAADSYRIPFEDLKDKDVYNQSVVKHLRPMDKLDLDHGYEKVENISKGYDASYDEFEPQIQLFDVWVPRDNMIYTWAMDSRQEFYGKGRPVAEMPYDGPEFGPYKILGFDDVPENIMPASPAGHVSSLMRLVNNLMRKQSTQARNQRDVYLYSPASADAARRIHQSSDQDFVEGNPEDVSLIKLGGVDSANQAFLINVMSLYDRMAGNLSAMLGLGPQSETATQESLIHGAVNKREAIMQLKTFAFAKSIIKDLGYMLFTDAAKAMPLEVPLDGVDYSVREQWTPEEREGDFFSYNFELDLYSMAYSSPAQRMATINQLVQNIYLPASQLLAAQGGVVDLKELSELHAELLNSPRLKKVIKFNNVTGEQPMAPSGELPKKPLSTSREYVRRNVSGVTEAGRNNEQIGEWLNRAGDENKPGMQ